MTAAHGCEPGSTYSLGVLAAIPRPSIMVVDAARRRCRKHADPLRSLPRWGAARALALCDRASVDRRSAGGRVAQPAGAARLRVRGPAGVDRLLDCAAARAGMD